MRRTTELFLMHSSNTLLACATSGNGKTIRAPMQAESGDSLVNLLKTLTQKGRVVDSTPVDVTVLGLALLGDRGWQVTLIGQGGRTRMARIEEIPLLEALSSETTCSIH